MHSVYGPVLREHAGYGPMTAGPGDVTGLRRLVAGTAPLDFLAAGAEREHILGACDVA